ncbi:DUF6252 family protein [Algibacter sp. 2305UL17-15]|uniref:DUF6252 family protein n=1 Tax=Algibacter sp. 2305UL17-15 TaxID=3231268 RepID=UPI0034593554
MKHLTYVLLTALIILGGCKNDDDNTPIAPIDQLPPATKFGANTAGCLVNGEVHLPNNKSLQPLSFNYINLEDFTLKISHKTNDIIYTILISVYDVSLVQGNTYPLNIEFGENAATGEYLINAESYPSPNYYSTTPIVNGELTITFINMEKFIMSGTFWFDAINSENTKIEIREGRFDMIYNR